MPAHTSTVPSTADQQGSRHVENRSVGNTDKNAIHLRIPPRYLVLTGTGAALGMSLGLMRGGREEGWRFLAENAHRAPTTLKGWYLYKKTKNYRMMWAGLKAGGHEAMRLAGVGFAWAGLEDGMERVGLGVVKELGAGLGTAAAVCTLYRVRGVMGRRMVMLGGAVGGMMSGLRYAQGLLGSGAAVHDDDEVDRDRVP